MRLIYTLIFVLSLLSCTNVIAQKDNQQAKKYKIEKTEDEWKVFLEKNKDVKMAKNAK